MLGVRAGSLRSGVGHWLGHGFQRTHLCRGTSIIHRSGWCRRPSVGFGPARILNQIPFDFLVFSGWRSLLLQLHSALAAGIPGMVSFFARTTHADEHGRGQSLQVHSQNGPDLQTLSFGSSLTPPERTTFRSPPRVMGKRAAADAGTVADATGGAAASGAAASGKAAPVAKAAAKEKGSPAVSKQLCAPRIVIAATVINVEDISVAEDSGHQCGVAGLLACACPIGGIPQDGFAKHRLRLTVPCVRGTPVAFLLRCIVGGRAPVLRNPEPPMG